MTTTKINDFAITDHSAFVHVFDPALSIHHYLRPGVLADLDLQTLGSQERLMDASEFAVNWRDEVIKTPAGVTRRNLVEAYMGAAPAAPSIPAAVLDAVRALNASVAGV